MSIRRQCAFLGISRSSVYYTPRGESPENLALMRRMDELSLQYPFYGSRQMARHLGREGVSVGRRRVRRLMRLMGLEALYRKPRTSGSQPGHRIYPYLLRDLTIDRPDQVWCADITYIPVTAGFLYLVAIITGWPDDPGWRGKLPDPAPPATDADRASSVEEPPMTDILTPQERSALMRRIRGADTKPDLFVRRGLHASRLPVSEARPQSAGPTGRRLLQTAGRGVRPRLFLAPARLQKNPYAQVARAVLAGQVRR